MSKKKKRQLTSNDDLVEAHRLVVLVVGLVEPQLAVVHGVFRGRLADVQPDRRVVEHTDELRLDLSLALEEHEIRRIFPRERRLDEGLVEDTEDPQGTAVFQDYVAGRPCSCNDRIKFHGEYFMFLYSRLVRDDCRNEFIEDIRGTGQ